MTDLQYCAVSAMRIHKKAYENWTQGNISRFRLDSDSILCVQYESSKWWHYKGIDFKHPVWW